MPESDADVAPGRLVEPRLRSVPMIVALDCACAEQPSWVHSSSAPPTVSSACTTSVLSSTHSPL